jgi:uncharacterized membrane protein (GlpM family)
VQAYFPSFAHHHIIIVCQERKLQCMRINVLIGLVKKNMLVGLLMFMAVLAYHGQFMAATGSDRLFLQTKS